MKKSIRNVAAALVLTIPLVAAWFVQTGTPLRLTAAPETDTSQINSSTVGTQAADAAAALKSVCKAIDKSIADNRTLLQKLDMSGRAQACYSSTGYLILVNLTAQRVGIFSGEKEKWQLQKYYACSSGARGSQTPTGKFRIQNRGTWFYNSSVGEGARWWTGFDGNYLIHSLPMDLNRNVTCSTLGQPLSHGCVRVGIADAKWIYDTVPQDSLVWIYHA